MMSPAELASAIEIVHEYLDGSYVRAEITPSQTLKLQTLTHMVEIRAVGVDEFAFALREIK